MPKSKWLQEVEDDAVHIQTKRFKDQLEEMEYQKSKQKAEKQKVLDKKGK